MSAIASASWWGPVAALWKREVVRFLRQRSRVIGALGTPVIFWVFLQLGLGRSFSVPGLSNEVSFGEYFYAGTVAAILLFTAIFSTISVIVDRTEGFLQSVLVAPSGRSAIVMGKVMGWTTLATGAAMVFLLLAPVSGGAWVWVWGALPLPVTDLVVRRWLSAKAAICGRLVMQRTWWDGA